MYKIIGLGKTGCAIADEFSEYPEYRVYKINSNINERASLSLGSHSDMEKYEKNIDKDEVSIYLRTVKPEDEVLFIVEGGEPITGASLSILETIKDSKINVLYIMPDRDLCSLLQKRDDRVCFYVFQEYARSGMFHNLFLVNRTDIESLMGDVSIQEHEKHFSYFVAYVFAMLNYFKNTEPVLSGETKKSELSKISTLGVCSLKTKDNYLFPLEDTKETIFYYGVPKKDLDENTGLMREIKQHVKNGNPGVSAGFSIIPTTLDDILILSTSYSSKIQKMPKEF